MAGNKPGTQEARIRTAIAIASQSIGIGAVLGRRAKRFYIRYAEFIEYPEDSRTLFLPIETVVSAFS